VDVLGRRAQEIGAVGVVLAQLVEGETIPSSISINAWAALVARS
jgi:hypothetical protein